MVDSSYSPNHRSYKPLLLQRSCSSAIDKVVLTDSKVQLSINVSLIADMLMCPAFSSSSYFEFVCWSFSSVATDSMPYVNKVIQF